MVSFLKPELHSFEGTLTMLGLSERKSWELSVSEDRIFHINFCFQNTDFLHSNPVGSSARNHHNGTMEVQGMKRMVPDSVIIHKILLSKGNQCRLVSITQGFNGTYRPKSERVRQIMARLDQEGLGWYRFAGRNTIVFNKKSPEEINPDLLEKYCISPDNYAKRWHCVC